MGRALGGSLAAAVLLLSACGAGDDTSATSAAGATRSPKHTQPADAATSSPTPSPSSTATPSPSSSPSSAPEADGPPFPPTADPQTARPKGDWDLQLVDVRVGDHDGFDRVVLELAGTATPGWGVAWADRAVAEGSGEVVPLAGDRVLTISASGTAMPVEGSYEVPQRLAAAGDVAEVYVNGWFEGYTQVFAGIEGDERPFRVFTLADPPRLVVDVAD